MRSLERRFKNIQVKNPYLGTTMVFYLAVQGQSYSERTLRIWFNLLVRRDDYESKDVKAIFHAMLEASLGSRGR
jgi:hypothetical protein